MKKVALFGGSFDPVHKGHIELASMVLKKLDFDEFWFIVAYDQPLKATHYASFDDRVEMLKKACKPFEKMRVITVEKDLPKPSYTFNTVSYLKSEYPEINFTWVMGADNLENLHLWYKIEELKNLVEFLIVARSDIQSDKYKTLSFNNEASSSKVRSGHFKYLDTDVLNYIIDNRLYFKEILFNNLSDKRAKHSLMVTDLALELAEHYDLDMTEVFLASILHDIAKELDKSEELSIMNNHYKEHLHYHQKVYHQFTGEYLVKNQFLIHNDGILKAISSHTTGDDNSLLSKIVYLSDKLERSRPYQVEDYISLSKVNIDKAFDKVKTEAVKIRKEG